MEPWFKTELSLYYSEFLDWAGGGKPAKPVLVGRDAREVH
jgi:hypothetical protein